MRDSSHPSTKTSLIPPPPTSSHFTIEVLSHKLDRGKLLKNVFQIRTCSNLKNTVSEKMFLKK